MIPSHDYAQPSEQDVLDALTELFGEEASGLIWEKVCACTGVARPASGLSLNGLELAIEYLKRWPGLAGLVGRSMSVRIRTFRSLHAQQKPVSSA